MNLSLFSLLTTNSQAQTSVALSMMNKFSPSNLTHPINPALLPFLSGLQQVPKNKSFSGNPSGTSVSLNTKEEQQKESKETPANVKVEAESSEKSRVDNLNGAFPLNNMPSGMERLNNFHLLVQKSNLLTLFSGLSTSKMPSLQLDNTILGNITQNLSGISSNQQLLSQLLQGSFKSWSLPQGAMTKNGGLVYEMNDACKQTTNDTTPTEPKPNKKIHKAEKPKKNLSKKVKKDPDMIKDQSNEDEKKLSPKGKEDGDSADSIDDYSEDEDAESEEDSKEDLFKPTKHCYYVTKKTIKDKKILPKRTLSKNSQNDEVDPAELISSLHEGAEKILGYKDIDHKRLYSILVKSEMKLDITFKKIRSNLNYYKKILKLKENESSQA